MPQPHPGEHPREQRDGPRRRPREAGVGGPGPGARGFQQTAGDGLVPSRGPHQPGPEREGGGREGDGREEEGEVAKGGVLLAPERAGALGRGWSQESGVRSQESGVKGKGPGLERMGPLDPCLSRAGPFLRL